MFQTTSYQTDTPHNIWREFMTIHEDDYDRINARIVELLAQDVQQHTDRETREQALQEELELVLGGDV